MVKEEDHKISHSLQAEKRLREAKSALPILALCIGVGVENMIIVALNSSPYKKDLPNLEESYWLMRANPLISGN